MSFHDNNLRDPSTCEWTVITDAHANSAHINVTFLDGWIFSGSTIPLARLLQHEQLHWDITLFAASLFDPYLRAAVGEGSGHDSDFAFARTEAHTNADDDLQPRLDAIFAHFDVFVNSIHSQYDAETTGGEVPATGLPDHQLDWNANWTLYVQVQFDFFVLTHPELDLDADS